MSIAEKNEKIDEMEPSELALLLNDLSAAEAVRVVCELDSHAAQDRCMSLLTGETRERARVAISIVPARVYCRAEEGLHAIEVAIPSSELVECSMRGNVLRRHGTGLDPHGNFEHAMFAYRPSLPMRYTGTLGAVYDLDEVEFWRRVDPAFAKAVECTEVDDASNAAIELHARPVRKLARKPIVTSSIAEAE